MVEHGDRVGVVTETSADVSEELALQVVQAAVWRRGSHLRVLPVRASMGRSGTGVEPTRKQDSSANGSLRASQCSSPIFTAFALDVCSLTGAHVQTKAASVESGYRRE